MVSPVEPAVGLVPVNAMQIVDHVAAGDDEDAVLTQWRELRAEFEVVLNGRTPPRTSVSVMDKSNTLPSSACRRRGESGSSQPGAAKGINKGRRTAAR